jgi:ribosomal subunit interface protein
MKIIIKATGVELTESLKNYINKKFLAIEKFTKSFETNTEIILKIEIAKTTRHHNKGQVFYVECTMPVKRRTLRIEETNEDMYAAIDIAQNRLKKEFEKFKEKLTHKDRKAIDKIKEKE